MSTFNLGGAVNSAADWVCNAPIIGGIVNNPVFTSLLITALAAIVVMALYHNQLAHHSTKRAARAVLYVFMIVTAVTFVHHYAVMKTARESSSQKGVRDIFSSIQQQAGTSSLTPVVPMGFTGGAREPTAFSPRPDNILSQPSDALEFQDVGLKHLVVQ